jgi:integrase
MVRVQLLSGCRPNEIMRLSPGQIDRSGDVWKYTPVKHKNAWRLKSRTVYFGPQAQAVLLKYLVRPDDQCCFLTGRGKPFARGGYRQAIRRACVAHDIEHWVPGQLRHTKATELRQMRNLEAARAILGHSSSTVTQIYAEMNEEPALEIARKLG